MSTGIIPVRHMRGRGWTICEEHKAQMWEAMLSGVVIGRYPTKKIASQNLEQTRMHKLRPRRSYRLGSRMISR